MQHIKGKGDFEEGSIHPLCAEGKLIKQIAKFVVGLGEKVALTGIKEGMRVSIDHSLYSIQIFIDLPRGVLLVPAQEETSTAVTMKSSAPCFKSLLSSMDSMPVVTLNW